VRACQPLHLLFTDEAEYVWVVTGLNVNTILSSGGRQAMDSIWSDSFGSLPRGRPEMTLDKILRGSSGCEDGIWYPDRGRIPASMHRGRESNYEPLQTRASD
jgi:hypothetical protein